MGLMLILKGGASKKKNKNSSESKFHKNLSDIAKNYFPFKDPSKFDYYDTYSSIDLITFKTSRSYSKDDVIRLTGLKTIRESNNSHSFTYWDASYREYMSFYHSEIADKHRSISSVLYSINQTVKENQLNYSLFIERYSGTIENINTIINRHGIHFVMNDTEIEKKLNNLVSSFVKEYKKYTKLIEDEKKNELLKLIESEQEFVDISIDSLLSLGFKPDIS